MAHLTRNISQDSRGPSVFLNLRFRAQIISGKLKTERKVSS